MEVTRTKDDEDDVKSTTLSPQRDAAVTGTGDEG